MPAALRAAVLTVSDSVVEGTRPDRSGPAVQKLLEEAGWTVTIAEAVPDELARLKERLSSLVSRGDVSLVVTTGGTGLGPRDVTPEATVQIIERELTGLAETMRRVGSTHTPFAVLSRAVAGVAGRTLLLNLPGSPAGATQSLSSVLEVLPHAVAVLHGGENHPPAKGED